MDVILSKIYNKNRIKRYINFFIGALICAISYNLFILPYNIVFGGVGGISIIVSNFITIKPSVFIFVCCMILCVVSFIVLSPKKTIGSLIGGIVFPILVELTSNIGNYINVDGNDMLLFTVFGGITYGIGLGLIMKADFTLGGTDIITQIVSKYTKMTIGNAMLIPSGILCIVMASVIEMPSCKFSLVVINVAIPSGILCTIIPIIVIRPNLYKDFSSKVLGNNLSIIIDIHTPIDNDIRDIKMLGIIL